MLGFYILQSSRENNLIILNSVNVFGGSLWKLWSLCAAHSTKSACRSSSATTWILKSIRKKSWPDELKGWSQVLIHHMIFFDCMHYSICFSSPSLTCTLVNFLLEISTPRLRQLREQSTGRTQESSARARLLPGWCLTAKDGRAGKCEK